MARRRSQADVLLEQFGLRTRRGLSWRAKLLLCAAGGAWYGVVQFRAWWPAHEATVLPRLEIAGVILLAVTLALAAVLFRVASARKVRRVEAARHVESVTGGDGSALEDRVADLVAEQGLVDVTIPGGAGDLGADVIAYVPGSRWKVVIQCKGYTRNVGSKDMQAFCGTVWGYHGARVAVFVTSAPGFSTDAAMLAEREGIFLVARDALAEAMAGRAPLIPAYLLADGTHTAPIPVEDTAEAWR